MRFKSIFVTGTDTGVGKTTVSSGIAAALRLRGWTVGVYKPAETGCPPDFADRRCATDAGRLRFFSGCRSDLSTICPYALREPLAPLVAAERERVHIEIDRLESCHRSLTSAHDITLIEGAGGLLVPLTPAVMFADLAKLLDAPVLVVVGSRLGAINHALLTVRYAESIGLRVLGYVVNFPNAGGDEAARSNADVLARLLGPALGVVPYLGEISATEEVRQRLARVFSERVRIDDLLVPC